MNLFATIARRLTTVVLALAMVFGAHPTVALADASRVVTLGVDLTPEQRANVLNFFGLKEADLANLTVVNVTNDDERAHLGGTIDLGVIGNKTYSCSYIQPTNSGGIYVQTANLTYVTNYMLYNALQTAGVKNCNLVVTAPFPVSGTGALTGVFMAYEATGRSLDDAKESAATQELVTTAELTETYGQGISEVVSDVKNQVVTNANQLTDDQIREIIRAAAASRGITLSDDALNQILDIVHRLRDLNYDADAFSTTLADFETKLREVTERAQGATGILEAIGDFFRGIWYWFVGLFNGGQLPTADDVSQTAQDFFGSFNTNVFKWDTGQQQAQPQQQDPQPQQGQPQQQENQPQQQEAQAQQQEAQPQQQEQPQQQQEAQPQQETQQQSQPET